MMISFSLIIRLFSKDDQSLPNNAIPARRRLLKVTNAGIFSDEISALTDDLAVTISTHAHITKHIHLQNLLFSCKHPNTAA